MADKENDSKETAQSRRAPERADDDAADNDLVNEWLEVARSHQAMGAMTSEGWNHLRAVAFELIKMARR